MKKAILLFTLIVFLLMGSTAWAEECYLELRGGIGAWKGPCKDGEAYGTGVATFPNGTYAGSAQDGRAHGRGKWRFEDGLYLEGEFRHGDVHGRHVGKDAGGNRITGELQMGDDGKRHLIFLRDDRQADDDIPAQDVASSRPENTDKASEANAASVDAATPGAKNEVESARRAESAPDPSDSPVVEASPPAGALARTPVREEPDAHNCRLEADGEFFDWSGPCRDGRAHGNGRATLSGGMTYAGSAKDGKLDGYGTVTSASEQMLYQGGYRGGVPHGRGTYLDEDGRYYVSDFEGGDEVGERMPAQGFASDESGPENASDTDVLAGEAALPGVDEDGNQEGDDGYEAAVDALDGGDGVVRVAIPDDDYDAKLTELERREIEERATASAREAEKTAEATWEKIDEESAAKRRAAFEAEKKRRRERLERAARRGAAALNEDIESAPTRTRRRRSGTTLFGGSGGAQRSLQDLPRRLRQQRENLARQRRIERQRRERQRQQRLERQRRERRRQEQLAHQRRVEQQRREQLERKRREREDKIARLARERDRKIASLRNALNRALARCNRQKRGRSGCRNHNRRFYNGEIRNAIRNYEYLSSR